MQTPLEQAEQRLSRAPASRGPRVQLQGGSMPRKSAFFGLRLAIPAALAFWGLLAALIWMLTR